MIIKLALMHAMGILPNYWNHLFYISLFEFPHKTEQKFTNFILFISSVGGIVVSIAAFQAVDPGSTPGHRKPFFTSYVYYSHGLLSS